MGISKWSRRRRVAVGLLATLLVACAALAGIAVVGNNFRYTQRDVTIPTGKDELHGVLVTPREGTPAGVVLMLHGDGPVTATHDGLYAPLFEAFTDAGWAVLSWNKPGAAGAPGQWLHQTMQDRADEAVVAATFARKELSLDEKRVGLWAASQGGWVAPLVVKALPRTAFVVAASPAISWQQQSAYLTQRRLERERITGQERASEEARVLREQQLLETGANYEQYRAALRGHTTMTADRWRFVSLNYRQDAATTLPAMRTTPTLLQLAGHDDNVDVANTQAGYTKALAPDALTVKHYPDADHSLAHTRYRTAALALPVAVLWPRALFAPDVLADITAFVRRVTTV